MTLHYVTGSAKIHNSWDTNGAIVPTYMFSPEGTYLGMNELNGMIFGCGEFSKGGRVRTRLSQDL